MRLWHPVKFIVVSLFGLFISPPGLRDAQASRTYKMTIKCCCFVIFLTISLRPIISTSTGPIFTKCAGVYRWKILSQFFDPPRDIAVAMATNFCWLYPHNFLPRYIYLRPIFAQFSENWVAITQRTLPWFVQFAHSFRHSDRCVINFEHSATTHSTVTGVIHKVDRRRVLLTTPTTFRGVPR